MEALQSTGKLDGTLLILLDPVPETDLQLQIDEAIVSVEYSGQVKVLIDQLAKHVVSQSDQPIAKSENSEDDDLVSPIDKSFEDLSGSDWDPTDSLTDLTDDVRDKRSGREKRFKQP